MRFRLAANPPKCCILTTILEERCLRRFTCSRMGEQPIVLQAIELTSRAIRKRTKSYKALVVAVSLLTILSLLSATFLHQWIFLGGLIFLVPLIGGFFYFDSRTVRRWRREIFQMRDVRNLDLDFFLKTIGEVHRISPPTLKRMLSTINLDKQEGQNFDEQQQKLERLTLVATILLTSGLICFVGAAYYRSIILLFCGIAFAVSLAMIRRGSTRAPKEH
jgi:hypothetical protein